MSVEEEMRAMMFASGVAALLLLLVGSGLGILIMTGDVSGFNILSFAAVSTVFVACLWIAATCSDKMKQVSRSPRLRLPTRRSLRRR